MWGSRKKKEAAGASSSMQLPPAVHSALTPEVAASTRSPGVVAAARSEPKGGGTVRVCVVRETAALRQVARRGSNACCSSVADAV